MGALMSLAEALPLLKSPGWEGGQGCGNKLPCQTKKLPSFLQLVEGDLFTQYFISEPKLERVLESAVPVLCS